MAIDIEEFKKFHNIIFFIGICFCIVICLFIAKYQIETFPTLLERFDEMTGKKQIENTLPVDMMMDDYRKNSRNIQKDTHQYRSRNLRSNVPQYDNSEIQNHYDSVSEVTGSRPGPNRQVPKRNPNNRQEQREQIDQRGDLLRNRNSRRQEDSINIEEIEDVYQDITSQN